MGAVEKQDHVASATNRKDPLPVLRTPDEVCAWLGVTRRALYIMVDRGQIPTAAIIKIGARLRFDESRLKDWIAEKRAPSRGAM